VLPSPVAGESAQNAFAAVCFSRMHAEEYTPFSTLARLIRQMLRAAACSAPPPHSGWPPRHSHPQSDRNPSRHPHHGRTIPFQSTTRHSSCLAAARHPTAPTALAASVGYLLRPISVNIQGKILRRLAMFFGEDTDRETHRKNLLSLNPLAHIIFPEHRCVASVAGAPWELAERVWLEACGGRGVNEGRS
jgi:hypothetical protein